MHSLFLITVLVYIAKKQSDMIEKCLYLPVNFAKSSVGTGGAPKS